MRILAAIAMLGVVCGSSCAAADEPTQRQVVFVCEHGNVKSVMAASYFNQLAEQQHLPFRADDVPPASSDFAAARASLRRHVAELIQRLRQASGS